MDDFERLRMAVLRLQVLLVYRPAGRVLRWLVRRSR